MTEKEMIEEMAVDLAEEFVLCGTLSNCGAKKCSYCYAKYLYKQGYRKIPKGAVVRTREENEEWFDFLKSSVKEARKETAREIYIKACDYSSEMGKDRATQFSLFIHWLSKQFCLEVE